MLALPCSSAQRWSTMEGGATAQLIRTLQGAPDVRLTACTLLPKQQIVPWEMNLVDRGQTKKNKHKQNKHVLGRGGWTDEEP